MDFDGFDARGVFGRCGLADGRDFGLTFGILSAFAINIAYLKGFETFTYRPYRKPQLDRHLTKAGIVRGFMIGVAGAASGASSRALNTVVTLLSPPVEWWADNLPDRVLGGYEAFLVLIGSALHSPVRRPPDGAFAPD
jgi:hypothetical protein